MRTREVTFFQDAASGRRASESKPALTYQYQLDLLKSRGLVVPDEPFALHCLEQLSSREPKHQPEMNTPANWQTLSMWKPILASHP